MRFLLLLCLFCAAPLLAQTPEYTGGPYFFKNYDLLPGLPKPKNPIVGAEEAAIRKGEQRNYAYIEALYSPTGKLRQMRKLYKGKVLWKYEFIYVEGEVQKVIEYDSKGRSSTYYQRRS
jgi:hypothetical protein